LIDLRPILLVIGALSSILGVAMFVPAIFDLVYHNEEWRVFMASGLITILFGLGLFVAVRGNQKILSIRQVFLMSTLIWVVLSALSALPLYWSSAIGTYTDAFFEAMSGLTTTGSTIISHLDGVSPGVLLWRGMLQWIGGLGIIAMAIAVLPMLRVNGMQLFRAEGFDTAEKILPSVTQISGITTIIYVLLTLACTIAYSLAGMSPFESFTHAMATLSTGGFSTRDASIGGFGSAAIDIITIVFMILGSLPFFLFIKMAQVDPFALAKDSQVRVFLYILASFTVIIAAVEIAGGHQFGLDALRHAAFNVVSIITTTGYITQDFNSWGAFSMAIFFLLMFVGGCAGSTAGGVKIFRWQVLFEDIKQHVNSIAFPSGIFVKRFNGKILSDKVSTAVLSFFFLYMLCFAVLAALLSLTGLDTVTALSGAATAISNVGPGLGNIIGPVGNFSTLNDTAKWLLSAGMLLGRLEFFTVLVLLSPAFWRV